MRTGLKADNPMDGTVATDVMDISRRNFIFGSMGAAVAFGFSASEAMAEIDLAVTDKFQTVTPPMFEPTIWFSIDTAGVVTVNVKSAEMGQHIGTAMAKIVAEELGADWQQIQIIYVDYAPKWGQMQTGGSWSVWQAWPRLSKMGAAARQALLNAGSALLGVPVDQCTVANSMISANGKSISYGDIVKSNTITGQFTKDQIKAMKIKPASQRVLVGKSVRSMDILSKTNGSAKFGIDARVEGMVYARPVMPPVRNGAKVLSVDDSAAKSIRGYQRYVTINDSTGNVTGWVLAIGTSYWAAFQAAERIKVTYDAGPNAKYTEADIIAEGARLISDRNGGALIDTGNHDTAPWFEQSKNTLEQTYITDTILHFQLEPVNALAFRNNDGLMEIHSGCQFQTLAVPTVAKSLGVSPDQILLKTYYLGGAFGRRLDGAYIIPAALAAAELGKPVKLILARPDDALFDCVRTPSITKFRMAFSDKVGQTAVVLPALANQHEELYATIREQNENIAGDMTLEPVTSTQNPKENVVAPSTGTNGTTVVAMECFAAAGWPTMVLNPSTLATAADGNKYDPFAISGADHWYSVGPQLLRSYPNQLANEVCRSGYLRSVSAGWTAFGLESFIDEAAHHIKADPVEFRLNLLRAEGRNEGKAPNSVGGANRQAHVLRVAVEKSGYGKTTLPADTAMGVASHFGQERTMPTWNATVAQVHVDRKTGMVDLQKLTMVFDAGTLIDPDGALAQVQGAAIWGISLALLEGTAYVNGQVKDHNLTSYTPARISNVPPLDITFIQSTEVPTGLGEPGIISVAPAIANAIFNAVGARLRRLPMLPKDIKAAISS